ncbi:MAG: hypothetical protein ACHQET_09200 [Chitinophagales bacterium]
MSATQAPGATHSGLTHILSRFENASTQYSFGKMKAPDALINEKIAGYFNRWAHFSKYFAFTKYQD